MTEDQIINEEDEVKYAGFWLRAAAMVLDVMFVGTLSTIVSIFPTILLLIFFGHVVSDESATDLISLISYVAIGWLYPTLLESSKLQATVGKLAVGIHVVDANGERLTMAKAFLRNLAKIVSYMTVMIGFFMAGWTQKKQALHDMIVNTCVIVGRKI